MVTSSVFDVPDFGSQRSTRSGRGRPTKFLIMSVISAVRRREMARPRMVTCALWTFGGRRTSVQRRIIMSGVTVVYMKSQSEVVFVLGGQSEVSMGVGQRTDVYSFYFRPGMRNADVGDDEHLVEGFA